MYKENNKGPRTVPCGKTRQNQGPIRFCTIHNNSLLSVAQKRIYPFQRFPTYATAKQFALKELMRQGVECFLKI